MKKLMIVGPGERKPDDFVVVNTTSHSTEFGRNLSPFTLGPCPLYAGYTSLNMENAWQYAKVYAVHAQPDGTPLDSYWDWATSGWNNARAVRYPMGRGAAPLYSLWNGERLGYIAARKKIYAPLYAKAVLQTNALDQLKERLTKSNIALFDFDGYDYEKRGMTLGDVINNPKRPMGHAFVLKLLVEYGRFDIEAMEAEGLLPQNTEKDDEQVSLF